MLWYINIQFLFERGSKYYLPFDWQSNYVSWNYAIMFLRSLFIDLLVFSGHSWSNPISPNHLYTQTHNRPLAASVTIHVFEYTSSNLQCEFTSGKRVCVLHKCCTKISLKNHEFLRSASDCWDTSKFSSSDIPPGTADPWCCAFFRPAAHQKANDLRKIC